MRGKAIFGAAVLAGASYWPGSRLALDPALLVAWKGAGVGLLALWAALCVPGRTGRLLAIVLALGAAGDVLLAAVSLEAGAVAFLAGHIVAIRLYLTNKRPRAGWLPFLAVPPVVALAAWLPADPATASGIALYATGLAAMAASATVSRWPFAALGAWLFVASDLLIFAGLGPLAGSQLAATGIWPLYFAGQALIAFGVGVRPADAAPTEESTHGAGADQARGRLRIQRPEKQDHSWQGPANEYPDLRHPREPAVPPQPLHHGGCT